MKRHDVFGMCNALFDIQAEVQDQHLFDLGLSKGTMALIDRAQHDRLLPMIQPHVVNTAAGGSGANTMLGTALLGGRTVFTSRVGADDHGARYRASLADQGVKANLGEGRGRTGTALVLVTPDAQRTMLAHLGDSQNLTREDVVVDDLQASQYLYVTGYLWDTPSQKEAVLFAMREANRAGVKVAFSLSDPFCVGRHRDDFRRLVADHVDVVFGNAAEAQALTDAESPREAARRLAEEVDLAVVTLDREGSLIQDGAGVHEIPAHTVEAIDTTGAGDMYAAGLLYGLTRGLPLRATGRLAAYAAAMVVARFGPRLESIDQDHIGKLSSTSD